jgi:serine-aspartate repeat-containing protein C/D/E
VLSGLLAGTYRVREVQPGGWTATVPAPSGSDGVFYDAIVATNTSTVSGDDFGNAPIQVSTGSGVIQGILFNDANGNGTRQKKEKPLAGWQVFADVNNDGLLEAGEPAATSDAAGNYGITGLGAGVYHIREFLQPGWIITTPAAGSFDATLATDNRIISAPPFGSVQGARITGLVVNDATGKGRITRGIAVLANWRVFLDVNGDGTWQPDEPSAITNSAGQYTLTSLRAGRYMLRVQPQAAWQQTRPARGAGLRVKLSWKKTLKAQPFGEHQIG